MNEKTSLNIDAVHAARQMSDQTVDKEELEKIVDRICQPPRLNFAVLDFAHREGTRRGGKIIVEIPFAGGPKSLVLRPSRSTVLKFPAHVNGRILSAELPDDDRLDDNVNALVDDINRNVQSLKKDWSRLAETAKTNVTAILINRKKVIAEQKQRDAQRSFPIK